LKATRKGFLKGCPNISKKLILKYLKPSPAMAKRHMKQPQHGIRSTASKHLAHSDSNNDTIANVFCFGAFSDKITGIVYTDMTGNFPFISLDGSVCYLIVYHYKKSLSLQHQ
jgi:hypothetical protein